MSTYHFDGAVAYDRLGSSWRTAAGLRSVSVTDPTTGLLPANLVQGGVAVSWLTADVNSRFSFTCDVPGVVVDFGAGSQVLYANEVPGLAIAAGGATNTAIDARMKWAPSTAYTLGQQILSPNSDVVKANVAHTSAGAYATDVAKWDLSATYVPTDPALRGEFTPERYSATVYTDADGGPAVNSAIAAAVAAGGGTIVISKPITFSTPLSATGLAVPVHFRGVGGATTVSGKQSSLTYTGTGSGTAFDCSNSSGLGFSDLFLTYNSGSFTGRLLDLAGGASRDGSLHKLRNMLIRPASTLDSHAALVYLDKSTSIDFDSCILIGSKAIYGKASNGSYSNRVTVRGGYLQGRTVEPVWNPGMTWRFDGVTFESLTSGLAGAVNHDAGVLSDGLAFAGCYLGDDSSTAAGAWITYAGASCEVSGGSVLSVGATGSCVVKPNGTGDGPVSIRGCTTHVATLGYLVDLSAATTPKPVIIDGNAYSNLPTLSVKGTVPGGSFVRAPNAGMTDYGDANSAHKHIGDVSGRVMDYYQVVGDTSWRLLIESNGLLWWGNGAGVSDVQLSRSAAGVLGVGGVTVGTTAPGAGAAGALPATPAGYWTVNVNGTNRQIPYY